jgi:hypothetical protein
MSGRDSWVQSADDGRRIVAAAALPRALRLELADNLEVRSPRFSPRERDFTPAIAIAGVTLAVGGLLCAAGVDAPPFAAPLRAFALIAGGLLCGLFFALTRRPSMRPPGGQGLVVGPTSLVIVDHHTIEVLPAERLERTADGVTYDGVPIDDHPHEDVWVRRLETAIQTARSDAHARAADPFRRCAAIAAAGRRPLSPWPIGLGVLAGLLIEVAVGLPMVKPAGAQRARWDGLGATALAALDQAHQRAAATHQAALDAARAGGFEPMVAYLSAYRDGPGQSAVLTRLRELVPTLLRDARDSSEVRPLLDAARKLHFDDALAVPIRTKFIALARAELPTATPERLHPIVDAARHHGIEALIAEAEASLTHACALAYPLKANPFLLEGRETNRFSAELLRVLCREPEPKLHFTVDGGDEHQAFQAASLLAQKLALFSRLSTAMAVTVDEGGPAHIAIQIEDPHDGSQGERPCRAGYRLLHDDDRAEATLVIEARCSTEQENAWWVLPRH